ncbi:ATP-binding protein [Deinococcus hohokamensis]|uniref:histidine kinase n=1 Tax=Deinococcus hohokamensis TaxID=309883 RepID=A0ABV9I8Q1_9DEIO
MTDIRASEDLLEDQAHRLAALDAFVEFNEAVGTETDRTELARQAIRVVRLRFPGSSAVYYEPQGELWTVRAWSDDLGADVLSVLQAGLPGTTPVFEAAVRGQQAVFTDAWDPQAQAIEHTGEYGMAAHVPLVVGGEVCGMLGLGVRQRQQWSAPDQALVRAVARGLNLALDRAALLGRLAVQNAELAARGRALEAFAELSAQLGGQQTPLTLVRRAQEVVLSLLPEGYSAYYELDGDLWRQKVQTGERGDAALQAAVDTGLPYAAVGSLVRPWTSRSPWYQDQYDVARDELQGRAQHLGAVATLPVMLGGEPVGIFAVALFHVRHWTAADRAVLETVVQCLGQALERVQSVAQLGERTRQLEREQLFLRAVLDNLSEGVVACDASGRLTLFNGATRTFHGMDASPLAPEEWAGHYALLEADGRTPLTTERVPLFRAWQGETVRHAELVIRAADGQVRHIVANGQPLRSGDGTPLGAVVTMHDLSARKAAEEEVRRTNAELRRSNDDLAQFASVASHDLQAPLRAMVSFADLLERRCAEQLDDRARLYLRQITQSGLHMKRLVDDLLTFSQVHAAARPAQVTDSAAVTREVLSRLAVDIEAAGALVQCGELPAVMVDPGQLDSLMQNLVSNAMKYCRPGVMPEVRISAVPQDRFWRFAVQDNGIGIEPSYRARIFEMFQRLHTREEIEGTGLGLAICKKVVERHGGELWVEGAPGEGSTFFFTLPASPGPEAPAST